MDGIKQFKDAVKADFIDWKDNKACTDALMLNQQLGLTYFDVANPQHFTGDITAELVLIHLNPKRNTTAFGKKCNFESFENYWSYHKNFGALNYGINSPRTHKSQFDHKQIRFLTPFNILPFIEDDKFHNLETVVDKKLQLELIPFGSPEFDTNLIVSNNLLPYLDRITKLILAVERKYVLFCGKIFTKILQDFIIEEKSETFRLLKNDGTLTRDSFDLIKVKLQIGDQILNASIIPQFAKQGAPISKYGEKVAELLV